MELERIEEESGFEKKAIAYNAKSKAAAHIFGNNLSLIICFLLPALFVFTIWTRPTINAGFAVMGDFAMTVVIFLAGQRAALNVGIEGGKLDDEYLSARAKYREERDKVIACGISLLPDFCEKEISEELDNAIRVRCRRLKISRAEMEEMLAMTPGELAAKKGKAFAAKFEPLRRIEPIELTDDMLLSEGRESAKRGGLGKGAEEHLEERWRGKRGAAHIAISILTVVFSVAVGFAMSDGVSIALIVYTIYKMLMLLTRMANSYRAGAKAYNTYEAQFLANKTKYLVKYQEFVKEKEAENHEGEEVHTETVGRVLRECRVDRSAETHCQKEAV